MLERDAGRRLPATALLISLRPHQWTKNLLLLAGLLFASELGDLDRWTRALVALAAYCAVSSAAYLINFRRRAGTRRLRYSAGLGDSYSPLSATLGDRLSTPRVD